MTTLKVFFVAIRGPGWPNQVKCSRVIICALEIVEQQQAQIREGWQSPNEKRSQIPSFHFPVGATIRFVSISNGNGTQNVWPSSTPPSGFEQNNNEKRNRRQRHWWDKIPFIYCWWFFSKSFSTWGANQSIEQAPTTFDKRMPMRRIPRFHTLTELKLPGIGINRRFSFLLRLVTSQPDSFIPMFLSWIKLEDCLMDAIHSFDSPMGADWTKYLPLCNWMEFHLQGRLQMSILLAI